MARVWATSPSTRSTINSSSPISTTARSEVSEPLEITLRGATPGETISFLLSIHDAQVEECCSFEVTLELPSCDCAQLRSQSRACKRFSLPWQTPGFTYSFTLENLTDRDVEHVLIAPASPKTVEIQPNYFSTSLEPGESVDSPSITVTGQGSTSSEVCFLTSLHDASFSECCALEHCVNPTYCFLVFPDLVTPLGDAEIEVFQSELRVTNLGESGFDGVGLPIGERFVAGCNILWDVTELRRNLGANLNLSCTGTIGGLEGQPIGETRLTGVEGGVALISDFSAVGARGASAEIYRRGELVATVGEVENGAELVRYDDWPRSGGAAIRGDDGTVIVGHEDFEVDLGDGETVIGDQTVVLPVGATATIDRLDDVQIRTTGISHLIIEDLALAFDCNQNGIEDLSDVISGASEDRNGNGHPDECERDLFDQVAVLNTGFDEVADELLPVGSLPEGTTDTDWTWLDATPPGPAKVVIDPVDEWPPALPESRWISADPNRGRSIPGLGVLRFERCFCLSEEAREVEVNLLVLADDLATVSLNGEVLGGPGGDFDTAVPLQILHSEKVGAGVVTPGENCLTVEVDDVGSVVTGFTVTGEVRAENGVCH